MAITGSEMVGLVPLAAILQVADYYMEKEKLMILEEDQKVHLAINRLGLSSLHPFNAKRVTIFCFSRDCLQSILLVSLW